MRRNGRKHEQVFKPIPAPFRLYPSSFRNLEFIDGQTTCIRPFWKLVQEAKQVVKECNVQDVKGRLDRGESFHLVDVREDREWEAKPSLPAAIHLGKGVIERDIEKAIPTWVSSIVLYCGGGFRSALAAKNLQEMGYTNVISMDGGYSGWKNAGYPLATT